MGEHQLDKLGVTGSSPVPPIKGPANGAFLLPHLQWLTRIGLATRSLDHGIAVPTACEASVGRVSALPMSVRAPVGRFGGRCVGAFARGLITPREVRRGSADLPTTGNERVLIFDGKPLPRRADTCSHPSRSSRPPSRGRRAARRVPGSGRSPLPAIAAPARGRARSRGSCARRACREPRERTAEPAPQASSPYPAWGTR